MIPICHGDTEIVTTLLHAGCRLTGRSWGNTRYSIQSHGQILGDESFTRWLVGARGVKGCEG